MGFKLYFFRYRLVKHVWKLSVSESLQPQIQTQLSESQGKNGSGLCLSLSMSTPPTPAYHPTTQIKPVSIYLISERWKLGTKCFTAQNSKYI